MLQFSEALLLDWISGYFWPFCRISAFFLIVPILGTRLVPVKIRLLLALSITFLVAPNVEQIPGITPLSPDGIVLVANQITIGIAMAFIVQILFQVCVVGGQMIAMQNGLGFATLVDPVNGVNVASISQLYLMSSNLIFLSINGHLWLINTLSESFSLLPIGQISLHPDNYYRIAGLGSWLFTSGLMVALPAVTGLLLVNIAFGVISKVSPQMNIFSIGFPFTMVFGLVIIWFTMAGYLPQFLEFVNVSFMNITTLLQT